MSPAIRVGVVSSLTLVTFVMLAASSLDMTACSSGDVAVGSTEQQAPQTNADGSPTGDGQQCSWDGTLRDGGAMGAAMPGTTPSGTLTVGDALRSPDGCNDCRCTVQGISCTVRVCPAAPTLPACVSTASDGRPSGTCAAGSQCVYTDRSPSCPPGASYGAACANQYRCTCGNGTWTSCEIVGGCLGVVKCPGAPPCEAGAQLCPP